MGAKTQAAVFAVLQTSHSLLKSGRTATQREVYYLHKTLFASALECNQTILRVCALLSVPRHRLGIVASSRGYFAGCLELYVRVRLISSACVP
jgi:DNA topoisomerase VI subunit A